MMQDSDTDKPSSPQPSPATTSTDDCENVDTLSGSDQDEYDDGDEPWDYYEEETTTPPITNSKNAISGIFYHTAAGDPKYAPFLPVSDQLHDRPFSFIREPITIMTSSNGLLCCRGRSSGLFYVCNPLTTECTVLPALNNVNVDTISAVLVLDDQAIDGNYHLVCTHLILDEEDITGLVIFNSKDWEWKHSQEKIDAKIVLNSGVSVGSRAYWRTEDGRVVWYVVPMETVGVGVQPVGSVSWALGELKGELCCISVEYGIMGVVWLPDKEVESWKEKTRLYVGPDDGVSGTDMPLPIRSQGGDDLLFWEDLTRHGGRQVVAHNMATGGWRKLGDNVMNPNCELVPYILSDKHIKRKPEDQSSETKNVQELGHSLQAIQITDTKEDESAAEV